MFVIKIPGNLNKCYVYYFKPELYKDNGLNHNINV